MRKTGIQVSVSISDINSEKVKCGLIVEETVLSKTDGLFFVLCPLGSSCLPPVGLHVCKQVWMFISMTEISTFNEFSDTSKSNIVIWFLFFGIYTEGGLNFEYKIFPVIRRVMILMGNRDCLHQYLLKDTIVTWFGDINICSMMI